ncbi:MAG: glycosyltransferase family 2 protein [Blastocatellia bacterium]|nr:glycosyltransferase family 2 protein [Blastocatellia bacterium]
MAQTEIQQPNNQAPLVSVVLPCLNEEEAIGDCIRLIQETFAHNGIDGEIVVCDNGSTDASVHIAESLGVRVVHQPIRGYGNAYIKGFGAARGRYFIMGDADSTYDFRLIPAFLAKLQDEGCDFVTGSRYLAGGQSSIPFLHRIFGNPALTAILNLLFGSAYTDVYCGFRGFHNEAYRQISPVSPGMEYNLELAINAGLAGLKIAEIPIKLHERKGESKLRTFRDGWRSLRMMLLYCPNKVFLYPGLSLLVAGLLAHLMVLGGLLHYQGRSFGPVTSIFATVFSVIGFEILGLGLHAKTYSWGRRFDQKNPLLERFYRFFNLEMGLLLGSFLILAGVILLGFIIFQWFRQDLQPVPRPEWASFGATLVILGWNTIFTALFISAMSMQKAEPYEPFSKSE